MNGEYMGDGTSCDPSPCDCNGNGVPDGEDIAEGTSEDCNGNGIPDECDLITFGDFDADGIVRLEDFSAFVDAFAGPYLPPSPADPLCTSLYLAAFDADFDGDLDLADFAGMQVVFGGS